MQTQGISLVSSGMTQMTSAKNTSVKDSTFDNIMTESASKTSVKKDTEKVLTADTKETSVPLKSQTKVNDTPKENVETLENLDVEQMSNEVMTTLKKVFGMTEEELLSIMEDLGICIQDLMFQIQNSTDVTLVNTDAIQELVMGIHGIEDKVAFLTNDTLNAELTQITDAITEIVADALGVLPEELKTVEPSVMLSFAEQVENVLQTKNNKEEQGMVMQEQMVADDVVTENGTGAEMQNSPKVVVEDYTGKGQNNDSGQEQQTSLTSEMTTTDTTNDAPTTDKTLNVFAEKLSQAVENNNGVEQSARVMTRIVEQVVHQVRIRVMPESTSMELQLNPASLGKVQLQVASANGVATATLTVENQVVKEALESQMITLKQTFEEQGLKVDSVEVTVSDFSLKKEDGQNEQQSNKSSKRRFRLDIDNDESVEDVADSVVATAESRRDVNSMVDYTA